MNVGWIGLGAMGEPAAAEGLDLHLLDAAAAQWGASAR